MNNNLRKGQKIEKKIEKTLKGSKRTIGSGNSMNDGDLKFKNILIESKAYNDDNITFYEKFWNKIKKQAIRLNKIPALIYTNNYDNYVIMNFSDICTLFTRWKVITLCGYDWSKNKEIYNIAKLNKKTFIIYPQYFLEKFNQMYIDKMKNKKYEYGILFPWKNEKLIIIQLHQLERIMNKK